MDPRVEIAKAFLNTCYVSDKAFEGICAIIDEGAFSTTSGDEFNDIEWQLFSGTRNEYMN